MTRPITTSRISSTSRTAAPNNGSTAKPSIRAVAPITQGSASMGASAASGALDKAASAQATSTATALRGRHFPNPVAVYSDSFVFTTLDEGDLEKHKRAPFVHPHTKQACRLFTLDNEVEYRPFAKDYGPLNLAYTVHGVCTIQDIINDQPANARPLCLYTMPSPETKVNIALLASLYHLLVEGLDPATAFMPIAKLEVMPFRDAGNGVFDHALSVQDCLYGIEKAHKYGLLGLDSFDIKEYVYYEQVLNGDLNILGPFIPFASPMEEPWLRHMRTRWEAIAEAEKKGEPVPPMRPLMKGRLAGNQAFRNVLNVFEKQRVGLVVRLNDELYDKRHFTDIGMDHVEMYFDDGTCPTDEIVRDFIDRAVEQIERGKKVAVHCKAGLGRTGVLIGAYFIYKYGFSAQEVIGFMRIVRPGMVVGQQQQYMLLNQMKWAQWAAKDELKRELGLIQSSQATMHLATPPADDLPLPPLPPKDYELLSPPLTAVSGTFDIDMEHYETRAERTRQVSLTQAHAQASYHKHGDAVGQPRKAANANGKRYVEAPSPAAPVRTGSAMASSTHQHLAARSLSPGRMPSPSLTPERVLNADDEVNSTTGATAAGAGTRSTGSQSLSAGSAQSSMRGTKRGNRGARAIVSAQQAFAEGPHPAQPAQPGRTTQAAHAGHGQRHDGHDSRSAQTQSVPTTPRAAIDLPTRLPYLERSPSLVSVTSENDRPRKKMHGTATPSPLSPLGPGAGTGGGARESSIPGANRGGEYGISVGSKLRKDQPGATLPTRDQYITGLPASKTAGGMPSMGSVAATQGVTGVHAAADHSSSRRAASRIPTSAPASSRRQASPLRESTAQASTPLAISAKHAQAHGHGHEKERTPTPVSATGSTSSQPAGSRIPRMGMAPGSPLMRALKGYQSDRTDKGDKGDKGDRAARGSRLAPQSSQYGISGAAVSGIPSASASAPAASRRQGMMGAMGALSPPRLGAMWSGLGRTQGELRTLR